MTKPQRYGSTWSLSRMCQALMGLGFLKIMLFAAIGFGYTLPSFGIVDALVARYEQNEPSSTTADAKSVQKNDATQDNTNNQDTPLAQQDGHDAPQGKHPSYTAAVTPAQALQDPQGSEAVRAALAYKADPRYQYADTIAHTLNIRPEEQALAATEPVVKAEKPAQEDISWWDNVLAMTSLPIPRLGVDQVAYAATLDAPPAPAPRTGTTTPFTPPSQVLPAGVAGPKTGVSATESLLVPNTNPPAPRLDAYVPPEDPNRKQQELARREQEILMLKKQMEQRLEELQSAERKVQNMLKEAKGVEEGKVNTLISMYSNMKPRSAGAALENLDENIAAKILVSMKSKQAGEILSYMNPVKTAKLTEILSRMRLEQ